MPAMAGQAMASSYGRPVGQAAMQDADPAVSELVQGGVVALVPGSELVVVGASPG
jgi:hypothetical protein